MKKSIRPWLVLAASFILMFTTIGLGANGLSLLYKPVAEALNFSQTKFNLYYTIATLAGLVASPIAGKIFSKKFSSARLYIIIGGVINLACFVAYSFCRTLPQFYIASFFRGVSKFLLNTYGWQTAYWGMGVVSFVTIIIVVILAVPTPDQANAKPYGYDKLNEAGSEAAQNRWQGLTAGQALKTAQFWIMCIAMFIGSVVVMGVQQCVASSLMEDFAYSDAVAAGVVSVFMVFICVGKLVIGWIFDKAGVKTGLIYSCVLLVVSMVCMILAKNIVMAYAFAVAFGLGNMTSTVISTTMTSTTFGTKEYGTIYGTVTMFMTGGMSIGPVVSGAVFEKFGSYQNAWILYAAASVVTTALLVLVNALSKKLKEKYPA